MEHSKLSEHSLAKAWTESISNTSKFLAPSTVEERRTLKIREWGRTAKLVTTLGCKIATDAAKMEQIRVILFKRYLSFESNAKCDFVKISALPRKRWSD
jgi:hypothetical protein